ncbi:MAG: PadR family transcriptional regulator [Gammaproteobacteria bacterium]|nr:PadR family transcriptional regulator [Gammaproteobacteria bacterium]
MGQNDTLGEFEHLVSVAIMRLRNNAYGMMIRTEIHKRADRDVSIGAVYTTLERLEQKGLVSSRVGEPTPERGGRAKRYYKLTASGVKTLKASRGALTRMWKGLRIAEA